MSEDKKIIRKSSWKFRKDLARRGELTRVSDDEDTINNIKKWTVFKKKGIPKNHEEAIYKYNDMSNGTQN